MEIDDGVNLGNVPEKNVLMVFSEIGTDKRGMNEANGWLFIPFLVCVQVQFFCTTPKKLFQCNQRNLDQN